MPRRSEDPLRRFARHCQPDGDCILWIGARAANGYGCFNGTRNGRRCTVSAHRWIYEQLMGPVPEGLEIDHLCRQRACVFVGHMEPVTHRENDLRGESLPAANARKTACPRGHAYPPGKRECAICVPEQRHAARRRYRQRYKERYGVTYQSVYRQRFKERHGVSDYIARKGQTG